MRSAATNAKSLSRSKITKVFGQVGNCGNSVFTGIPLSCHMSHHGESSTQIIKLNLEIIYGTNNAEMLKMSYTDMMGDRGYNEDEYFEFTDKNKMGHLHTTKRGPNLAYKFGNTKYKTNRIQRELPERGPVLSLGATRTVGSTIAHFVAYRNGTGRITFLQSSNSALSYGNFDYVTKYSDISYGKQFCAALKAQATQNDYEATNI